MDDSWDWVEEELKKIQDDMPADPEMMQVVDAISVADFWKRRYDEELMLWERKLEIKEDEKKQILDKAQSHEMSIKQLDWKLKELERRWEQEKLLLEDRLKSKEVESALEKSQLQWEARLKNIEEENKALKVQLGMAEGIAVTPIPGLVSSPDIEAAKKLMEIHFKEREEMLKKNEENSKMRLERIEEERRNVSAALADKENILAGEKEKWVKLEREFNQMSTQMTQRLNGLKERENEHFVILEDLARGFAHKVRNYLGIISGTMQLSLVNFKMESDLEEQLKLVDVNVQDMLKSIEEFLNLARIPEMNLQPINLNMLLETAAQSSSGKLNIPNISIIKNFNQDVPHFKGDQKLFNDAFVHLIENAMEAMPQGGRLTLSSVYDAAKGSIIIKIADTGAGISENHIKKVFQPYFTSKKNHRGLGLTITKRIIDLHRGILNLDTVKGQGSTAVITLFTT